MTQIVDFSARGLGRRAGSSGKLNQVADWGFSAAARDTNVKERVRPAETVKKVGESIDRIDGRWGQPVDQDNTPFPGTHGAGVGAEGHLKSEEAEHRA